MTPGELSDEHEHTALIRQYAYDVVNGEEWPLSAVDLSKVTFEIRRRARKRHGVTEYSGDGWVTVGVSEKTIERAGFNAVKETIRHELVHVWQYQHQGETVELPNGAVAEDVRPGHTGCWYEWEELMEVQRTNNHYPSTPADYKYRIWCASCRCLITGRYRLCKTVKHHSDQYQGWGWCRDCDDEGTDGSTFVVTDDDDTFYDTKQNHPNW